MARQSDREGAICVFHWGKVQAVQWKSGSTKLCVSIESCLLSKVASGKPRLHYDLIWNDVDVRLIPEALWKAVQQAAGVSGSAS